MSEPAAQNGPMPFVIEDMVLRHQNLNQSALVITPKQPIVVGRERIERLRGPSTLNHVDRWLIGQVAARHDNVRIVLFRACNSAGLRVWQFDATLSEPELQDAGYVLTRALVPFHRRLLNAGVVLMAHTDWGLRECYAMRYGVRRREQELAEGKQNSVHEVDRWLLGNMLLHVALSLEHVTQRLLPNHLSMVDRRWHQVTQLLKQLPPAAVA